MKYILAILSLSIFVGCSSTTIHNNYTAILKTEKKLSNYGIKKRLDSEKVEAIKISKKADLLDSEITQKYKNAGYMIVGFSGSIFKRAYTDQDYINYVKGYNKNVNTVIYNSAYQGSTSGTIAFTTPTKETQYHSGSINGTYGNINYNGSTTSYGTKTTHIPYTTHKYANAAIFLAKSNICSKLDYGFEYKQASKSIQKAVGSRAIYTVTRVCKDSEAYRKGLFIGHNFGYAKKMRTPASKKNQLELIIIGKEIRSIFLEESNK